MAEDLQLELLQRRPRLEAELLDQRPAPSLKRVQRVGLPAAAIQRQHQLAAQPLSEHVLGDQRLELRHQLEMAAGRQVGVDPILQRRQPQLLQTGDLALRERLAPQIGQRLPPPQRQRITQPGRAITGILARTRPLDQQLKPRHVDLIRRRAQQIPRRPRPDPLSPQQLAQRRHMPMQRVLRATRRILTPQRLNQLRARDHLTTTQHQQRQQRTLLRTRRGQIAPAIENPQRTKQLEAHVTPILPRPCRDRQGVRSQRDVSRASEARKRSARACRSPPTTGTKGAPMEPSFHASPAEALQAPPEEFLYLACLHEGTGVDKPDFLAVVDAEEGRVVHETPMPNVGDELHHFGWNRCSSACHGPDRSHLIVPGFRSSRIHIVNVADDPRRPRIEKVIEPAEIIRATGLSRPHTVHCMPGGNVVISMLGDADGNGTCGFAVLDASTFELKGRWENGGPRPGLNYDFWYQPRHNVLASSEFGEPNAYESGFDLDDVGAGRYGSRLHFWNLAERRVEQTLELGETGLVPLEIRWLHDPDADQGFVGATLSSTMWHFHRDNGSYAAENVIAVESVEQEGWPFPVPGLITDLVVSMDDSSLYFSNWLHGDLRRYDISDPANPRETARLQLGGVLGRPSDAGRELNGGPQMLQLSLDGRRLYVSNSLYSTWDNQFYPGLRSWLLRVDCAPDGGMELDRDFFVDLHPARAHEVRLQGGDCTTEIFQ